MPLTHLFLDPPSLLSHLDPSSPPDRPWTLPRKDITLGLTVTKKQPCQELHTHCLTPPSNSHKDELPCPRSQMGTLKRRATPPLVLWSRYAAHATDLQSPAAVWDVPGEQAKMLAAARNWAEPHSPHQVLQVDTAAREAHAEPTFWQMS